jgi:hypothetical protein
MELSNLGDGSIESYLSVIRKALEFHGPDHLLAHFCPDKTPLIRMNNNSEVFYTIRMKKNDD